MSGASDKIIAAVLILATLGFFFFRSLNSAPTSQSPALSLEEARHIFSELGGSSEAKPVVVFETDWCPVCKALREELDRAAIPFVRVNVEKNPKGMLFYKQLLPAGRPGGVPLTMVGTSVVLGLRMNDIRQAYAALENAPSSAGATVVY